MIRGLQQGWRRRLNGDEDTASDHDVDDRSIALQSESVSHFLPENSWRMEEDDIQGDVSRLSAVVISATAFV